MGGVVCLSAQPTTHNRITHRRAHNAPDESFFFFVVAFFLSEATLVENGFHTPASAASLSTSYYQTRQTDGFTS